MRTVKGGIASGERRKRTMEKELYHVRCAAGEFVGIRAENATWSWPDSIYLEETVGVQYRNNQGKVEMSVADLSVIYEGGKVHLAQCYFIATLTADATLTQAYKKAKSSIIQPELSTKNLPPDLQKAMKVG